VTDFQECAGCATKLGAPDLCQSCLHNRRAIDQLHAQLRTALDPDDVRQYVFEAFREGNSVVF
jgi:hypothetical protein